MASNNYSSLRREAEKEINSKYNPSSLIDAASHNRMIRTKRNTSSVNPGMSGSNMSQSNKFQLQGFTIRPDVKSDSNSRWHYPKRP